MKKQKRKKRPKQHIFCNPDVCPNCEYVGEGDRVCMNNMCNSELLKNCKLCGCKMVWENPHLPGHFQASSCNVDDWDICHDCMVEYCCATNCYGCKLGKYPECRFLEMKRHYMAKDEDGS